MKIRTDFVTNSSSSSFVVEVSVEGKDGKSFYLNTHYNPDGNEDIDAEFNREDILKSDNISELADYLIGMINIDGFRISDIMAVGVDESIKMTDIGVDERIDIAGKKFLLDDLGTLKDGLAGCIEALEGNIVDDIKDADIFIFRPGEQNEAYTEGKKKNITCISGLSFIKAINEYYEEEWDCIGYDTDLYKVLYIADKLPEFNSFRENLVGELKSVDNISSICITKRMDSWGEGSGCTVRSDRDLCELLDEVKSSRGGKKKECLDSLEQYLKFPMRMKEANGIECEESTRQYTTDGWNQFPSGMAKTHWEYDWSEIATTIEGFVKNFGCVSDDDEGYEEVSFDMISKTVSEKALFTMKKKRR